MENNYSFIDETFEEDTQSGQGRNVGRGLILAILFIMFIISLILAYLAPASLSRPYLGTCVIMALVTVILQTIYRATGPRPVNWFCIDVLFMVSFFIIHFWYPMYWLMGQVPSEIKLWINESVVCYATMMSVSGLLAFMMGFNCLADSFPHVQWSSFIDIQALRKWKNAGRIIFLGGCAVVALYIGVLGRELFGGVYGGIVGGYLPRVLYLLLNILIYLGFIIMTIAAARLTGKWKIGTGPKLALMVFLVYVLVLGDRSNVASLVLLLGAAYSEFVKHISLKKFAIGFAAAMFLLGVARIARYSPERTISSFVKTALEYREDIALDESFLNFSGSVRTVYAAVNAVPSEFNYFYGRLKIAELMGVIPFSRRLLPLMRVQFSNSALFLTWIIHRSFASGAGATIIADLYVDFGYPGVVVFMFLIGWLCKYVQQKARQRGTMVWGVAHATMISTVALMPRYNILSLIRGVLWPVLMILVLRAVLGIPKQSAESQVVAYELGEDFDIMTG